MLIFLKRPSHESQEFIGTILRELGIAVHRHGYRQLCIGISQYARDDTQNLTKELYPDICNQLGYSDWRAVERSMRSVIYDAWRNRDPEVWGKYFPDDQTPPSNKQFIATLAEQLK